MYLNSAFYPYDDLNLDFGKKRYVLFDMYARFRRTYYGINCFETLLNCRSHLSRKDLLWSLIARDKTNPSRVPL